MQFCHKIGISAVSVKRFHGIQKHYQEFFTIIVTLEVTSMVTLEVTSMVTLEVTSIVTLDVTSMVTLEVTSMVTLVVALTDAILVTSDQCRQR